MQLVPLEILPEMEKVFDVTLFCLYYNTRINQTMNLEMCQALCDSECPQRLIEIALRDPSVFPKRIALFSLGTLAGYEVCKQVLLTTKPSIAEVIRWYRKPLEAPEVLSQQMFYMLVLIEYFCLQGDSGGKYVIAADDSMSMKYISRIRQKLKQNPNEIRQPSSASKKQTTTDTTS